MSDQFCELIKSSLGIPKNRIYIGFDDVNASDWGWNGGFWLIFLSEKLRRTDGQHPDGICPEGFILDCLDDWPRSATRQEGSGITRELVARTIADMDLDHAAAEVEMHL